MSQEPMTEEGKHLMECGFESDAGEDYGLRRMGYADMLRRHGYTDEAEVQRLADLFIEDRKRYAAILMKIWQEDQQKKEEEQKEEEQKKEEQHGAGAEGKASPKRSKTQ